MNRLEPGHAGEGHFERNGDLPLDFLGRGAGKLGEDFDDRRRRIGIGFDVHVQEREDADHRHGDGHQNHDKRVIQRPLDELANHQRFLCDRASLPIHSPTKQPRILAERIRGSVAPSLRIF